MKQSKKKESSNNNLYSAQNKRNSLREIKEWVQTIIIAVVLAMLIRGFIFEIILVDGSSMIPTLYDRNRVFVNKITYLIEDPQHGDVIIFKTPEDNKSNYVKRLIGLPGDKIKIENGVVYVNDEALYEPYIAAPPYNDYAEVVIPEDTFFALGDNRNDSKDSRDSHIGFISMDNLVGKAVWRIWPLNNLSKIH